MKGLRKYLTPFAPDQSGAVSVLYELGGIIVVCDAGGCAGNICGFDEPRWRDKKSAVFSAGLRDMDAILGRDDLLVEKLVNAADKIDAQFAAIVGTPVPAVIGTDYKALARMAERKLNFPIITLDTAGVKLYDSGAEKAYLELVKTFAVETFPVQKGTVGVLGVNPLDMSRLDAGMWLEQLLQIEGYSDVWCYGMGAGIEELRKASSAEKNIVVSPSGLVAAKLLKEMFGTEFEVRNPMAFLKLPHGPGFDVDDELWQDRKVLIIDQQVTANSFRDEVIKLGAAEADVATWFMLKDELAQDGDIHLTEEDDFAELVKEGGYDIIAGDPALWKIIPDDKSIKVNSSQFAVSGKLDTAVSVLYQES